MDLRELHAELKQLQHEEALWPETSVRARADALDFIAFIEEVVQVQQRAGPDAEAAMLARAAAQFKIQLTQANTQIFDKMRAAIRNGLRGAALRSRLQQFTENSPQNTRIYLDYDGLDVLLHGVLGSTTPPPRITAPEREMGHCEHTPARAILEMIDHVRLGPDDIFYDLGSGMGQVPILVHLLTGVCARGVEFEPAYCRFAQETVQALQLSQVAFVNGDARAADYSDGAVFFMFTPFKGKMLQAVLARLQQTASTRAITVCTFGSCTPQVAEESWLTLTDPAANHEYRLAVFRSR